MWQIPLLPRKRSVPIPRKFNLGGSVRMRPRSDPNFTREPDELREPRQEYPPRVVNIFHCSSVQPALLNYEEEPKNFSDPRAAHRRHRSSCYRRPV